jgi:4-hydroxy-tetrahydrodipicolinate reductase
MGRMGQLIAALAHEKGFRVSGHIGRVEAIDWEAIPADVIIDFSHGSQVEAIVRGVLLSGKALVTGTTGWEAALPALRAWAESLPAPRWLYASNFARGIRLMKAALTALQAPFQNLSDWEAALIETHHRHKKDAPSGTAKHLMEHFPAVKAIHSIRVGEVIGEHRLVLSGPYETIEIVHRAHDRRVFAEGALWAAAWLVRQNRYIGPLP